MTEQQDLRALADRIDGIAHSLNTSMLDESIAQLREAAAQLPAGVPSQEQLIEWAIGWRASDTREGLSGEADMIERITYAIRSGMLAATPQPDSAAPDGEDACTKEFSDIHRAYLAWPADIRKKLSLHDLRRMTGWRPPTARSAAPGGGENAPLDAVYAKFEAMDNQDVPLEQYPQAAVNALAHAGWAIVPCGLPFELLGESARNGMMETGNPKHVWDYLISKTRLYPAPITTPIADAIKPEQVDTEARARELLAAEYERMGYKALVTGVREFPFEALSDGDEAALLAIIAALSAPKQVGGLPDAVLLDRGFQIKDGVVTPTLLFGFNPDDWAARDRFAAMINTSPQAAPVPVEGEGLAMSPPDGDSFAGWAAWLRDRIATLLDPYVQRPHAEKLASWLESLEDTPPTSQPAADWSDALEKATDRIVASRAGRPAVELEQFRPFVVGYRGHIGSKPFCDSNNAIVQEADRLLALLDGAKAVHISACEHSSATAHYDHATCDDCGCVLTDSGWGIAKHTWFASLHHARFYKKNGRLPEPAAAPERDGGE